MALLVIIILVALVAVLVSISKGMDSSINSKESTVFQNHISKSSDFSNYQQNSFSVNKQENFPKGEDDFDQLMKPGSNSAAWFNEADERGYEPEDW